MGPRGGGTPDDHVDVLASVTLMVQCPAARHVFEAELVVHQNRDRVPMPTEETACLGGGEPAQKTSWTCMEHREPAPLLPGQGTGRGADDPRRVRHPPSCCHLVTDSLPFH